MAGPLRYWWFAVIIVLHICSTSLSRNFTPAVVYDALVFQNGHPFSYQNYRIPVLAVGPVNQTLVVVVEQRLFGTGDHQPKNIVYKYSEDFGITW